MLKEMGIEGEGPKIMAIAAAYLVIAYLLNRAYPNTFVIANDHESLSGISSLLLIIGIILWLWSVILILLYFPKGKLITAGPFKLFLNPLYNSFALFILPAAAFYLNSWIYFGASIVMLIAEMTIGKAEERYLAETFGKGYDTYREKVIFKI